MKIGILIQLPLASASGEREQNPFPKKKIALRKSNFQTNSKFISFGTF